MRKIRLLLVASLSVGVSLMIGSPAHAACEQFEVGTPKWQRCVEDVASGGTEPGAKPGKEKGSGGGESESEGDVACSEFNVGTPKWEQCIKDKATGGGTELGDDVACSEFNVGTPKWSQCIEDAATGGGLMPWIVIIPLGVMVVGMAILFIWQSIRGVKTFSPGHSGSTAAVWLIFISLIEIGMGVAFVVAESRADGESGGFSMAAYPLIGIGVLMLIAGIVVAVRSAGKRRIAETGLVGEGKVMSLGETGTTINEHPVIVFDLEVTSLGLAPYRTTTRSTVPLWNLTRIPPGTVLPVRIDPDNNSKIVIEWDRWNAPVASTAPSPDPTF